MLNEAGQQSSDTFLYKGEEYRYLGRDYDTKEKVLDYLEATFSMKMADRILEEHAFIVHNGKLAQPNRNIEVNYQWDDAEATVNNSDAASKSIVQYKVPVYIDGKESAEVIDVSLRYSNGWKVDGLIPLTIVVPQETHSPPEIPANTFTLTDDEMFVYKQFSQDLNESHLKDLPPISIAKLYVQASLENRKDVVYALYTDRPDYIRMTKEEFMNIPEADNGTYEKTLQIFNGIQNGEFIQQNEIKGYIKYDNGDKRGNGFNGFQMVKDEDGIWNVGFNPIQ